MENYQVCSVQDCVQQLCTVQGTHMNRPNSCLLDLAFLWLYCVLQFSVLDLAFGIILCYSLFVYVCFCCVRFNFFSTVPRDGGGGHLLVQMEWRPARWSVCLPLLVFPCTIKSRSSLLAPAHPGGPGKRAVKWLCMCVCAKRLARNNVSEMTYFVCCN